MGEWVNTEDRFQEGGPAVSAVLCEVVLPAVSGKPEDDCVNTFSFQTPSTPPTSTELAAITGAVRDFYNTIPSGNNAIAGWINSSISRVTDAVRCRFFNLDGHLDGSPHGSPISVRTFTLGAMVAGGVGAPREVACALTIRAAYGTAPEFGPDDPITGEGTRPRARLRGRVYIGPLINSTWDLEATSTRVKFTNVCCTSLVAGGVLLRDAGMGWSVWSRARADLEPVATILVDDGIDTQRRRGEDALLHFSNPERAREGRYSSWLDRAIRQWSQGHQRHREASAARHGS